MRQKLGLFFILFWGVLSAHAQDSLWTIQDFVITGNKTSQPSVIIRELEFSKGDVLVWGKLEKKKEISIANLKKTALFNFVSIDLLRLENKEVLVLIDVTERWYTWPSPIFQIQENNINKWFREKNWKRTNVGLNLTQKNFRGRRESFSVKMQFGYLKDFGFTYSKPFFPKSPKWGFGVGYNFIQRDEVRVGSIANERQFLRIQQPVETRQRYKFILLYRPHNITRHFLEFRWNKEQIQDTILKRNPLYFPHGKTQIEFPRLSYSVDIDTRDNNYYPMTGSQVRIIVSTNGMPGDQSPVWYQHSTLLAKHFIPLSERWSIGTRFRVVKNWGDKIPYSRTTGFGYDHFSRGHELYNFDSPEGYYIHRNSLRWKVIQHARGRIPYVKNTKFSDFHFSSYLTLFIDHARGFDQNHINPLNNKQLFTTGIGLDLVTYYDKVMRFEVSRNNFGEIQVFLHLKQGI